MANILHQVGIKASIDTVFRALSTIEGLRHWWTTDTRGDSELGGTLQFWFNEHHTDFRVIENNSPSTITWKMIDDNAGQWSGTYISFKLLESKSQTTVNFTHGDWQEATELFAHCSTKWAVFLLSLKDYCETGTGKPFPNDIAVNHN